MSKHSIIINIIALIVALGIATISGGMAVIGIAALFSAKLFPVLMGMLLEIGKVVSASWLKLNWDIAPKLLKWILVFFVVILMGITSTGVYAYLSKIHLEKSKNLPDIGVKISFIDKQLERNKKIIEDAQSQIDQLDSQIKKLIEFDKISGPDGSRAVMEQQAPTRNALRKIISEKEAEVLSLTKDKNDLLLQLEKVKSDVGPVLYVSKLFGSNNPEDAIKWVILILVLVFDPLAILILILVNHSIKYRNNNTVTVKSRVNRRRKKGKTVPKTTKNFKKRTTPKTKTTIITENNKYLPSDKYDEYRKTITSEFVEQDTAENTSADSTISDVSNKKINSVMFVKKKKNNNY